MKDYYKILGLKETASAEEIHECWVELMQKYHPDHGSKEARDEEVAKEINEAYQVLKYSSSRMQYDFERLHQRSPKKFSIKKFIFSISGLTGLTFLFVFCLICFLRPPVPPPPVPKHRSLSSKPEFSTIPHYEPGPYIDSAQPISKKEKEVKVEEEKKVISQQKDREIRAEARASEKRIDPSRQMVRSEGSLKIPPISSPKEVNLSTPRPEGRGLPSTRASRQAQGPEFNRRAQAEGLEVHPEPHSSTSPSKPGLRAAERVNYAESIEKSKPTETQKPPAKIPNVHPISDSPLSVKAVDRMTEVKPSSPVATEEEVKRFFANYIDRYNQRDIHGFLSLFSSKAIHNQKDGLEGIRRTYGNFFSQSQILQYHLEDLKMEIYQNAVEAKARYQIDQTSKDEGEKKVWQGRIQWLLVKEEGGLKIASVNYQNEKSP